MLMWGQPPSAVPPKAKPSELAEKPSELARKPSDVENDFGKGTTSVVPLKAEFDLGFSP
jgi:hypothetical protein